MLDSEQTGIDHDKSITESEDVSHRIGSRQRPEHFEIGPVRQIHRLCTFSAALNYRFQYRLGRATNAIGPPIGPFLEPSQGANREGPFVHAAIRDELIGPQVAYVKHEFRATQAGEPRRWDRCKQGRRGCDHHIQFSRGKSAAKCRRDESEIASKLGCLGAIPRSYIVKSTQDGATLHGFTHPAAPYVLREDLSFGIVRHSRRNEDLMATSCQLLSHRK